MNSDFEWMRIGLAMGLMVTAFILLPMFFLWKDKRDDQRALEAEDRQDVGAGL